MPSPFAEVWRNTTPLRIRVKGFSKFKSFIGEDGTLELEIERVTLKDVLRILCKNCGKTFEDTLWDKHTEEIRTANFVMVNGRYYLNLPHRLNTVLQEGDEITIMPMYSGG